MARAEAAVHLVGDRNALELAPADGAKVTSLRCLRHGREWLHGPPAVSPEEGFGASRSWGWDELFPTVSSGQAPPSPWPSSLRDHGELWGRPWTSSGDGTMLHFEAPGFRFTRALTLRDDAVTAAYELRNVGGEPFPWMWAMHPILALEPGDRLELPGVREVSVSYARPDRASEGRTADWPQRGLELPPSDGVTALKLYATARTAVVTGRRCRLSVSSDMPYLGIYLNLGGWPDAGSGLHQLGLEPTTAPVDDLATAVERGFERVARPGETLRWTTTVTID